ncbi:MAG: C25 family cysteine peptidase, partial [Bacteroidetes bacterium]|nr:C25 family cysteine peptidase [Bacteroidota bacterium]
MITFLYYESEATFYDESEVPPPRGWRNETGVFVQIDPHYDYHQPYLEFIESLIPSYFIVDEIDGAEENYEDQVYSALNEGVGTFTYFGHGYKNGWSTISTDDLESNLINEYKAPVVHGIACESGYFDFGSDCFGEAITTYSGTKGFTGYLGACRSVGCKADINDICYPPKYFQELIPYTIFNDLSHITGEYILESKMRNEANVPEYKYAFNFFGDPALNIMAQGFEVTDDITLPPITTISTKITVRSGVTLTVPTDGNLRFENNGKLIIEEGANLIFCRDDTIHAVSGMDSIIVYGNIAMGGEYASNNSFLTEENASFVIEIRNYDLELSIYGDQFTGVTLSAYTKSFLVDNCTFIDSYLKYYRNNDQTFELTNSQFTNSTVIASIGDMAATDRGTVIITGCDFVNSMDDVVINIGPYKNFMLLHDTLIYDAGNGINIHTSGSSVGQDHYIKECSIEYNISSTADTSCGIEIYHSYADIQNNLIKNNTYGVVCLDRSNVRLLGNESAQSADETQQIINNSHNQVFAIAGSFPHEFHWNVIYNNHPGHDTLVTYHTCIMPGSPFLYVEYNYWGPNFNPNHDLHPTGKYIWSPVWTPPWINLKSTGDDEVLFHGAEQAIIDGDYADAESDFKEIIENYPDSKYLQASVKELLALKRIYDHDFTGLKSYLDSVPTLQQDTETMNLTAHVSNW